MAGVICPSDDVLGRFGEGRVSSAERLGIEQHFDDCAACRELVAELGRGSTAPERGMPTASMKPVDQIGRYPVLGVLGAGAMGAVYLAHDAQLDRKVAIKVLRPGLARAALREEARSLAKLSHPNVVAVYEVAEWHGLDFVVMEWVDGATVADWLLAPRTWREVLDVFVAAGRGLAAAHRAQLVHRDIKPSNLLIGRDGRARVGDFGLAQFADVEQAAIAGTPAYMAPQQLAGAPADARSDQYAFCVALHEGLFAERPRDADSVLDRPRLPGRGKVPAWVRGALIRGLQREPSARFPTMDALLAALTPRTSRWRVIAAAGAVGVLAAGAIGWRLARPEPVDRCDGSASLAGIWDEPRHAEVRAAFAATGRGYAADTFTRVEQELDRYAGEWRAGYRDACEATHVRAEQSEAVLDKRMQCLRWRRDELAGLATALTPKLDDDVLARAISAAQGLSSIASCADVSQLTTLVPMPRDPQRAAEIEAAERELATVITLTHTGQYATGLTASTALLPRARATGYAPLIARALHRHAMLQTANGNGAAAETSLHAAAAAAAEAGDGALVASIWTLQLQVVGINEGKLDEAWSALGFAETAVALAGAPAELRASLLHGKALLQSARGEYLMASATHLLGLGLELATGEGSVAIARAHDELCRSLRLAGKPREADEHCRVAVELIEQSLGPHHPELGAVLFNRAAALGDRGELALASELGLRGLQIFEQAYPPDHPRIAMALNNIGSTLEYQEKYREALPYAQRVVALREHRPTETALLATALCNLGTDEEHLADHAHAEAHFQRALALQLATEPTHPDILLTLVGLGDVAVARKDATAAGGYYRRALAIGEASLGKTHAQLAQPLIGLARLATQRGDQAAAVALFDRVLALPDVLSVIRGYVHLELADVLWLQGRDRPRARAMVAAAQTELTADEAVEATTWLAHHR